MEPITGTLTDRDMKHNIAHAFHVAEGCATLEISLSFHPDRVAGYANMLCLTLFDPHGFRGAGHRHGTLHQVVISATEATPGYLAGPLPPGEWQVLIDTHMVMPGPVCSYTLTITASPGTPGPAALAVSQQRTTPTRPGPGWYRGDLHAHTNHSDADWTVAQLLAAAYTRGLDFATITDHNTIAHLVNLPQPEHLLVMGGMELTTFWGHALSLGTRQWIDWRIGPDRSMPQIADNVRAAGGLFVIAHPHSPGDPECTGCDWRYADMLPGNATHVEIWNGLWSGDSNNQAALEHWYSWLNQGIRIIATAGTDAHGPAPAAVRPGFNLVWARELSEPAILEAITNGTLYLSSGPTLEFVGQAGSVQAMVGGNLPAGQIQLELHWADCPIGSTMRLIGAGAVIDELIIDQQDSVGWSIDEPAAWYTIEIRSESEELLAITNPIFVGE